MGIKPPRLTLADRRWDEARRMAEGKAVVGDEGWGPDAKEKMTHEWAAAIGKAPPAGAQSPDVLAMALELFNAQMPGWLAEHWQQEGEGDE